MKTASFESQVMATSECAFVDITDELVRAVKDSGVSEGMAIAFCAHTTCALHINEWEDGALEDLSARLGALVPTNARYAHDDPGRRTQNLQDGDEPVNGRAHVAQMILGGSSQVVPVAGGEPVLGRWQRLFLHELDEPRPRRIVWHVIGV